MSNYLLLCEIYVLFLFFFRMKMFRLLIDSSCILKRRRLLLVEDKLKVVKYGEKVHQFRPCHLDFQKCIDSCMFPQVSVYGFLLMLFARWLPNSGILHVVKIFQGFKVVECFL